MKSLLFLFFSVISFNSVFGQTAKPKDNSPARPKQSGNVKKDDRPIRSIEIQNLAAEAYYTQPEFAADALMRLAVSKKVTDKQWKQELIEAAFKFAAEAQQTVRRKDAVLGGYPVDTDAGYLSYAFDQNLDKLSLQNRAVRMILDLDKQRARELLNETPVKLSLSTLSCDDALVYDVSDFYETLRLVAEKTFSPAQIEQGERTQFVLPYIEAISSHAQIVPVLKLIVALKPPLSESLILVSAFTKALKNIKGDDRSFSYELVRGGMMREVYQLAQSLEKQEISAESLLRAYRAYIQKNLNNGRCADSAINDERNLSEILRGGNSFFFKNSALTADDVKPEEILGKAKIYQYWHTPKAKRLLTLIKELRFGSKNEGLTEAEKQTPDWREQLNRFLTELESWNEKDERSEIDYFHQKQVLYSGLLELVPDGTARNSVVRGWVASLSDGGLEKQNRIEWRYYANYLLKLTNKSKAEEKGKMLEIITDSKSSSLVLYAKLAQQ